MWHFIMLCLHLVDISLVIRQSALTWSVIVPWSTLLVSSSLDDDEDDDDDERRRVCGSVWTPASTSSTLFGVFLFFLLLAASDSESLESELSESESDEDEDDDEDDDDDDECLCLALLGCRSVCISILTVSAGVFDDPLPSSVAVARRGRSLDNNGRS